MRRSLDPSLVVAALLLAYASDIASDETIQDDMPPDPVLGLSITKNKSRLIIHGAVSSTAHEAILRQTAARYLPGHDLEIDVRTYSTTPPGWSLVSDTTLRALSDTRSSNVLIAEQHIRIRGIVTDVASWSMSVDRINKSLLNGMRLELNVVPIENSVQFDRLCENLFAKVLHDGSVEFANSKTELGTGSLNLLDQIVEIATDCPTLSISVTGHTDDTGNKSTNRRLSKGRAESVVRYLIERGIASQRLSANGAGSATPLASNDNAAGRRFNRQIEFDVVFRN